MTEIQKSRRRAEDSTEKPSEETNLTANEELQQTLARIRSQITSKLPNQASVAKVLSALEDTLKDEGADENTDAAAYVAGVMSLIEAGALIEPATYLLSVLLPHTGTGLRRTRAKEIASYVVPLARSQDAQTGVARSAVGALESLIMAQDSASWQAPTGFARQGLAQIQSMAQDRRPKVRRAAVAAISNILSNPPGPATVHPALIASADGLISDARKHYSERDTRATVHALQAIVAVANEPGWPAARTPALTEIVLSMCRSADEHIVMTALEVFSALFSKGSVALDVVDAVVELRPSSGDGHLAPAWLAVVAQAAPVLATRPSRLVKVFSVVEEYLADSLPSVSTSAGSCLAALADIFPTTAPRRVIDEFASHTSDLLSLRFQTARSAALNAFAAATSALGTNASPALDDALRTVASLRADEKFDSREAADIVLCAAIGALGPDKVLSLLPLNIENPSAKEPGRAYLLPLLRDNISQARLGLFIEELLPLAERLAALAAEEAASDENSLPAKIHSTLVDQLWALLPRFCDQPTDLASAFSNNSVFPERLASTLYQEPERRPMVCRALRVLVNSCGAAPEIVKLAPKFLAVLFNVFTQTPADGRQLILDPIDSLLSITAKADVSSTFTKVSSLLTPALSSESKNESTDDLGPAMLDLVVAIVPVLPDERYNDLADLFRLAVRSSDAQIQKRAYRIITRLAESDAGSDYIKAHASVLEQVFIDKSVPASTVAARSRLAAIERLVQLLPSDDLHFIPAILPEAIISTKQPNEKTRSAAYELLIRMGEKMAGGGTVVISKVAGMDPDATNVEASIEEYFTMVCAGLAGATPNMISATITALSCLMYQYKSLLERSVLTDVVSTVDLFLTSKNREIVKSALGFVKVIVTTLPADLVKPRLPELVPNLLAWSHEHHARFKIKVRHLIERLVRRFGHDTISAVFPEDDRKLLTNIRKSRDRARRKFEIAAATGEAGESAVDKDTIGERSESKFLSEFEDAIYGSSDDSDPEEIVTPAGPSSKARGGKGKYKSSGNTYIIEGDGNDPLDLLDQKSLSRMSSKKPTARARDSAAIRVKTDEFGKFIVGDDSEGRNQKTAPEEQSDAAILTKLAANAAEANPLNAYMEAVKNGPIRGQRNRLKFKRGKRGRDSDEEDEPTIKRKTKARL
ncbi:armadillo-type protein [Dipodascopsis uninucleata]